MATRDAEPTGLREVAPTPDGWRQLERTTRPTLVQLPSVPAHITRDTLRDICRLLGLDPSNVRDIRLGINEMTATLYLSSPDGHKIRYGEDPAISVVTIPIH
ncbi:hypothetical protein [Streptomyces bacillaris]|uniref:hypothetical protein n=1 Tax=Streptomyces bacillaris TaxID=68179 RepID=UPI0034603810